MNKFITASIVAISTTGAWTSALAADPPVRDRQSAHATDDVRIIFETIDRNDDQRISKGEAAERAKDLRRRFAAVDSSGDGFLSRDEFLARPSSEPFE
jgi:Ca2+-binding EF-hand superfamily protein